MGLISVLIVAKGCGGLRSHESLRRSLSTERAAGQREKSPLVVEAIALNPQHAFAKELIAGFAAAEVDKLFETKGS